jgi:acyl-CoA-binding protein
VDPVSDLNEEFRHASERVQQLDQRPDNDTLLKLYALYKQGSEGDVSGERPGFFDFVGVAKYEAWEKLRGTDPDEAKRKYIDLVDSLTA